MIIKGTKDYTATSLALKVARPRLVCHVLYMHDMYSTGGIERFCPRVELEKITHSRHVQTFVSRQRSPEHVDPCIVSVILDAACYIAHTCPHLMVTFLIETRVENSIHDRLSG